MSGETYLTMSGNLTAAPKTGQSRNGDAWSRIRVASTPRRFDRNDNQWHDGATLFMDVVCWRKLAENVAVTLERGDRVLVAGRLHQRSYEDAQGVKHTNVELEAESVGPDLTKVAVKVMRRLAVVDDAAGEEPSVDVEASGPEAALA